MSKVLGFRSAKDGASIAIVEMQHCKLSFINREKINNKLVFPKQIQSIEERIKWLYDEVSRILASNKDINTVIIKTNEFGRHRKETSMSRLACYLDAAVSLKCKQLEIPVVFTTYSQMKIKTNSKTTVQVANNLYELELKPSEDRLADALNAAATLLEVYK